jgi:NAD(P)-dependent dehydrogenase (short-subunit alcohol dehydrogenase family)
MRSGGSQPLHEGVRHAHNNIRRHDHGRRALVTGASSGIGVETARALASAGAEVTLAVRNVEAGTKVATAIAEMLPAGGTDPQVVRLDLADPVSVADLVRAWAEPLDILVNNAGVMALPQVTRTAAGYELQFATNHLGHFALATGLHQWLAGADGARVVAVASIGHLFSPVVFDDLHGITVNALMPGNVASTALVRHMGPDDLANFGETTELGLPPDYWPPVPTSRASPAATSKTAASRP